MSDWQTIESAPKDGTYFLAIELFQRVVYDDDGGEKSSPEDYQVVRWSKKGWVSFGLIFSSFEPTHWMPLPPPPKE